MDLNGDGNIDILSGSYSRMDQDMAGLFQVLWGTNDGTFKKAEVLKGTDGEPLLLHRTKTRKIWGITISRDKGNLTDKICTRPTAVDLDGDGKLDIVSGNFAGSFAVFAGEGKGRFAPKPKMLTEKGARITVDGHSDPFFVDWDADGDLDLISGSSMGGVFLCTNRGSAKQPQFSQPTVLVPAVGHQGGETRLGDAHLMGPQTATRVWVDDRWRTRVGASVRRRCWTGLLNRRGGVVAGISATRITATRIESDPAAREGVNGESNHAGNATGFACDAAHYLKSRSRGASRHRFLAGTKRPRL